MTDEMTDETTEEKAEKPKPRRRSIQWGGDGFASDDCHDVIEKAAKALGMTFAELMRRETYLSAMRSLRREKEA